HAVKETLNENDFFSRDSMKIEEFIFFAKSARKQVFGLPSIKGPASICDKFPRHVVNRNYDSAAEDSATREVSHSERFSRLFGKSALNQIRMIVNDSPELEWEFSIFRGGLLRIARPIG